ncbi:MAG: type II toxin-antitoxin system CcdA family antitoxin [Halothiobacillaceae bacterium]|jgi:antitoxin CcdA|nr:type II toxin-antitoxin system CcdA family antitoxin [Halothiobacillaceae bacterium]MDY0050382.1 type II toxin-antitoxin system CcdA family antitoxin [Halothiobacillaceae bacterium]
MRMIHVHEGCVMGLILYDETAAKQATNVSINSDLLRQARELKINVSRAAEERLAELVRAEKERRLREELEESFRIYNAHVEKYGLFSEGLRLF